MFAGEEAGTKLLVRDSAVPLRLKESPADSKEPAAGDPGIKRSWLLSVTDLGVRVSTLGLDSLDEVYLRDSPYFSPLRYAAGRSGARAEAQEDEIDDHDEIEMGDDVEGKTEVKTSRSGRSMRNRRACLIEELNFF